MPEGDPRFADITAYCYVGNCQLCRYQRPGREPCACSCHQPARVVTVQDPGKPPRVVHLRNACPTCGKKCNGSLGVEMHLRAKHAPAECGTCEEVFEGTFARDVHEIEVHA